MYVPFTNRECYFSGFFYVKGHGISKEEIDTQFAVGQSLLALSDEEKTPFRAALEAGDYNGWKPAGTRTLIPGVKDNFEIYNIPKFIPEHADRPQPDIVRSHWQTIEAFSKKVHNQVVKKLLAIFAISLGLEEDWFVNKHRYEKSSGDHLRYMKYYHRTEEENKKLGGVWLKGCACLLKPMALTTADQSITAGTPTWAASRCCSGSRSQRCRLSPKTETGNG